MANVDMKATCRVNLDAISHLYKKTIVHNDFNNFCNTMNKVRVQVVVERDYAAFGILHVFSST